MNRWCFPYIINPQCQSFCLISDVAEGRMQAYGWSLPAKYSTEVAEGGKSLVSVPVPVYCRPLNLNDPGMKVCLPLKINYQY